MTDRNSDSKLRAGVTRLVEAWNSTQTTFGVDDAVHAAVAALEDLVGQKTVEPDASNQLLKNFDIATVAARRCSSCGLYGGWHEVGCLHVQRLEREKLQAACDHRSETKTRTIGDPPGPWCCGRCGLELPEEYPEREEARSFQAAVLFLWNAWAGAEGVGQPTLAVFGPDAETRAYLKEVGEVPKEAPVEIQAAIRAAIESPR